MPEPKQQQMNSIDEKSSQYIRRLIESNQNPLFTVDTEGIITDINAASSIITEIAREHLIGTDFFQHFTEPEKVRKIYKKVFKDGFVIDYPLTVASSKLTQVLFNGSPFNDDTGKVKGAIVVARDLTNHKKIEEELRLAINSAEKSAEVAENLKLRAETLAVTAKVAKKKAEKAALLAEEAVKSKQQFLSNMSHEIRTPMNAILGFTKVLSKTKLTRKQKECLNAIKISGDALTALINDILDLAKVDSGKMTFEQKPFNVEQSVNSMLQLFELKIREKNLKLVQKFDDRIPNLVKGDPVRLHQIILNLLSNAVKFTSKGSISFEVHLISEDTESVMLEFSITDTGIGIEKSKLTTIFENFQQAEPDTTRLYGGSGLGLAISKHLVEYQGGKMSVVSKPGVGSTFSFILTFRRTHEAGLVEDKPFIVYENLKNKKVLVVEDFAMNQLLMNTILTDLDFKCEIASNGKIAIKKLQEKSYDIILMDLHMPEMNGFEATEHIRKVLKLKTPIIALTADVSIEGQKKCLGIGMNDYLAKPLDEKLLYEKIASLIGTINSSKIEKKETKNTETITIPSNMIDLSLLKKRTKSNPKLMIEMIELYLKQVTPLMNIMRSSVKESDWDSIYSAAHQILPSFAIMGIDKEKEEIARKIQTYTSNRENLDQIQSLIENLDEIIKRASKELKEEIKLIKRGIQND